MARRPIPALVADRASATTLLQNRGIIPQNPSPQLANTIRTVHEATFSLILWKFRLKKMPDHGRVFAEEIASDALQILPQIVLGFGKTAKLLARSIVENSLRHVYFSDHPVEFRRMNREAKWYITFEDLVDYAKNHDDFIEAEPRFDSLNRITSLYSELSAGVHGRTVHDLEMRLSLRAIAYDHAAATRDAAYVARCAEAANFVLAIFHAAEFRKFQSDDRKIILRTMPAKARQAIQHHNV